MTIFSVEFAIQYLTFLVYYTKFPVKLPIDEYATHNYKQFAGHLVKVKQIFSILQGF